MAGRMRKVLAESDHACMDSLFPTRQRINGQLVYSANRLLGREVQTRYTRAASSSRLELKKKKECTLRSNWNISVVLFSGEVLLLIFFVHCFPNRSCEGFRELQDRPNFWV